MNDDFYSSLFKSGISVDTDTVKIKLGLKGLTTFRTFSPKVFSTVHPVYGEGVLKTNELQRRLIVIRHRKYNGDKDFEKITDYDWKIVHEQFNRYWRNKRQVESWKRFKIELRNYKPSIPLEYWNLYQDMVVCSLVCGFFKSIDEAIEGFTNYYLYYRNLCDSFQSVLSSKLDEFIEDFSIGFSDLGEYLRSLDADTRALKLEQKKDLEDLGFPIEVITQKLLPQGEIPSLELKKAIDRWVGLGLIDRVYPTQLRMLMASKGYQLDSKTETYIKREEND